MNVLSSSTRVLVTGYAGFAARHLTELLGAQGCAIWGIDRVEPELTGDAVPAIAGTFIGDITDYAFLADVVREVRPDLVFHLAAVTFGRPSGPQDRHFFDVNVEGTRLLCEALLAAELRPRVLVTGSSAVYGAPPRSEQPISETAPLRPQTIYASSKACQEIVALAYQRAHGLPVVVTRAFNHTGPGENPHFASSSFARQVAEIETGRREPPIRHGNLDACRDFLDVRDVVRGYVAAATKGAPGECYNVCAGVSRRMAAVLERLIALSDRPIATELDPERLQPSDVPYQCGSPARLRDATGWRPEFSFERALTDLLNSWRREVGGSESEEGAR